MVIFTRLMKDARTIKSILTYALAPLLLIILSVSVCREIRSQTDLPAAWEQIIGSLFSPRIGWLLAALVGTFLNWGLEALKWQRLMRQTEQIRFMQAFRGVLTGVSFTLFTPNRIGEYLGRIWHLSPASRGAAISLSVAGGIAQLLVTVLGGMIAYEFLWRGGFSIPILPDRAFAFFPFQWLGWSVVILLFVIYFNLGETGSFLSRVRWLQKIKHWMMALVHLSRRESATILGLSLLRYSIFLLQYYALFQFFGVSLTLSISFITVAFVFLSMALIPAMALADLGIRGQLSLWIVGAFSVNALGIVMTTTTIWFINLILPAVVGAAFLSKSKLRS
jgi:hypothetical protein